jgi:hypothetical protein
MVDWYGTSHTEALHWSNAIGCLILKPSKMDLHETQSSITSPRG